MQDDLIRRLAEEAGFVEYELDDGTTRAFDVRYARFAALVAAECAAIVKEHELGRGLDLIDVRDDLAEAIRAKFKEPT